jgi:hypothetical protein
LKALGIKLPAPPEPFGTYVEAVQPGNLLFLSGMLPTEGVSAPLREMAAISRKSLTPFRSCFMTSSEKTRALAASSMVSQTFRSAPRASWK